MRRNPCMRIKGAGREFVMEPGKWRSQAEHDVAVGPAYSAIEADRVSGFMSYFERRYHSAGTWAWAPHSGSSAAHHRADYIHAIRDRHGPE